MHAATPWNYALAPDPGEDLSFTAEAGPLAGAPFTHAGTPVRIRGRARRLKEWVADDEHVVAPLQAGTARAVTPRENVTLIPMGAARLRVTAFPTATPGGRPWTPEPAYHRIGNQHSGKALGVDGMSTANSAQVVQYEDNGTADHLWRLVRRPVTPPRTG